MTFIVDHQRTCTEFIVNLVRHYRFYFVDQILPVSIHLFLVQQIAALLGLFVILRLHPQLIQQAFLLNQRQGFYLLDPEVQILKFLYFWEVAGVDEDLVIEFAALWVHLDEVICVFDDYPQHFEMFVHIVDEYFFVLFDFAGDDGQHLFFVLLQKHCNLLFDFQLAEVA